MWQSSSTYSQPHVCNASLRTVNPIVFLNYSFPTPPLSHSLSLSHTLSLSQPCFLLSSALPRAEKIHCLTLACLYTHNWLTCPAERRSLGGGEMERGETRQVSSSVGEGSVGGYRGREPYSEEYGRKGRGKSCSTSLFCSYCFPSPSFTL